MIQRENYVSVEIQILPFIEIEIENWCTKLWLFFFNRIEQKFEPIAKQIPTEGL